MYNKGLSKRIAKLCNSTCALLVYHHDVIKCGVRGAMKFWIMCKCTRCLPNPNRLLLAVSVPGCTKKLYCCAPGELAAPLYPYRRSGAFRGERTDGRLNCAGGLPLGDAGFSKERPYGPLEDVGTMVTMRLKSTMQLPQGDDLSRAKAAAEAEMVPPEKRGLNFRSGEQRQGPVFCVNGHIARRDRFGRAETMARVFPKLCTGDAVDWLCSRANGDRCNGAAFSFGSSSPRPRRAIGSPARVQGGTRVSRSYAGLGRAEAQWTRHFTPRCFRLRERCGQRCSLVAVVGRQA